MAMKEGFERCADILLPLIAQCVPLLDALARDMRITKADEPLLILLAKMREMTNIPPSASDSPCLETMG